MKENKKKEAKKFLNKRVDVYKLYDFLGTTDNNEIIPTIFEWIDTEVIDYNNRKNSKKIKICLDLIVELAENEENLDIEMLKNKLENLYRKIDSKIKYNPERYDKKDFKRIKHTVDEIYVMFDTFNKGLDNSEYKFLEYIIFETKNHYFLENTLTYFPGSINGTNENGESIIHKVIMEYLKLIEKQELNDDIYYLDKVIDILLSSKELKFDSEEKIECRTKTLSTLLDLKTNSIDNSYIPKRNLLLNLNTTLKDGIAKKQSIKVIEKKFNIKRGFSREVLEQVVPDSQNQGIPPTIWNKDYIISIDGPTAIEIDDGLSARKLPNGNYSLGVHIASVTSYYDYNSLIVQNAIARGENIYMGTNVISIFPTEYSANQGSLLQGVPRCALSHYFEITKEGEIVDQFLQKNIIVNSFKTTYERVGETITKGSYDPRFQRTVDNLVDITKILAKKYNTPLCCPEENSESFANQIVLFATLLHNEEIANFFYYNGLPMIYRVQEKNTTADSNLEAMLKDFSSCYPKEDYNKLYRKIVRYEEEACYSTEGPHKGIEIEHYTHCSSPLRRGADIIAQRAIDLFYFQAEDQQAQYDFEKEVKEKVKVLNKQQENIKNFIIKTKPKK